ncbi:hypothetical protein GCM10023075_37200 [Streptosporangium album]
MPGGEEIPGALEMPAQVDDPRAVRGVRHGPNGLLVIAVICVPVGAGNFREAGDHTADLPQAVLDQVGARTGEPLRLCRCPGMWTERPNEKNERRTMDITQHTTTL